MLVEHSKRPTRRMLVIFLGLFRALPSSRVVYFTDKPRKSIVHCLKTRVFERRGIYPPLFTDPEGDWCFSIYLISWVKIGQFSQFKKPREREKKKAFLKTLNSYGYSLFWEPIRACENDYSLIRYILKMDILT